MCPDVSKIIKIMWKLSQGKCKQTKICIIFRDFGRNSSWFFEKKNALVFCYCLLNSCFIHNAWKPHTTTQKHPKVPIITSISTFKKHSKVRSHSLTFQFTKNILFTNDEWPNNSMKSAHTKAALIWAHTILGRRLIFRLPKTARFNPGLVVSFSEKTN